MSALVNISRPLPGEFPVVNTAGSEMLSGTVKKQAAVIQ